MAVPEYFIFEFSPMINPPSRDMIYTVYTDDEELLLKFFKHHNIKNGKEYVHVSTYEEADLDEIQELKIFKFASNQYKNKVYEICSTDEICLLAVGYATNYLSKACLFNDIIIREDLPIITHIKELIEKLDFGYILNLNKYDEYEDTKYHVSSNRKNWKIQGDRPGEQYVYSDSPDDSIIGDALFELAQLSEVMPITIESYVENFVSMITDEFK